MRLVVFLKRQFIQIKRGGWGVFSQKIIKGWEKILLRIFAKLAVLLRLKWSQAYYFISVESFKKYRKMRGTTIDRESLARTEREVENLTKQYIDITPDLKNISLWIDTNIRLSLVYFFKGDFKKNITIFEDIEKTRRDILKSHQLDNLGIEFIPQQVVTGCIGVYETLNTYVMAGILNWRPSKRMVLLLDPNTHVPNRCYLNYWSKYITIIIDPKAIEILRPLENCLKSPFHYAMRLQNKMLMSHIAIGIVQEQWDKENRLPLLTLSGEDFNRGWQILKSLGVPDNAWFVCLHVREAGWHEKTLTEDYRNADINDYIPAIKSVVAAGGWVVRMGDSSMKPLPQMPHVIDYALSDFKSDWMDVFLCSQCRFIIATSSGFFMVAVAFGVPAVVTNFMPAHAVYCLSVKDIFLPGLCRSKRENRYINFEELFMPPVGAAIEQFTYDTLELEVIKNSSEEIKDVVDEMLDKCNNVLKYSQEDEALQERFKTAMAEVGKAYGDERVVVNSRIGRKFLRKYSSLLSEHKTDLVMGGLKSI